MVIAVWSVKGGVGVSSVAAMMAVGSAERAEPTVLVDLCGDQPTVMGHAHDPQQAGVSDWLGDDFAARSAAAGLTEVMVPARPDLHYVARGSAALDESPAPLLVALRQLSQQVVVDCGVLDAQPGFRRSFVAGADASIVVLRQCFMTLRAMHSLDVSASGVVLVREQGRHLGRADVEAAAGAPIVAEIAFDSAISRSIDAGLARSRLPRRLVRTMSEVVRSVA